MTKIKRYSPLIILFNVGKLLRNSFVFMIYLYVVKANSESIFIQYGRIVFLVAVTLAFFSVIYKWFTHKYKLDDRSFHLYEGLFSKSERTIPFSNIHNVNRHTSLFHRVFKTTSIHFETGMTGEDAIVTFKVISQIEAERIEAFIKNTIPYESGGVNHEFDDPDVEEVKRQDPNRTIHFQPTNKDILKASFSSLNFLVLIPFIVSLYYKINEIFHVEDATEFF